MTSSSRICKNIFQNGNYLLLFEKDNNNVIESQEALYEVKFINDLNNVISPFESYDLGRQQLVQAMQKNQ